MIGIRNWVLREFHHPTAENRSKSGFLESISTYNKSPHYQTKKFASSVDLVVRGSFKKQINSTLNEREREKKTLSLNTREICFRFLLILTGKKFFEAFIILRTV